LGQQRGIVNPISTPPSPDAASLGAFGEYKMDNNTGKTNLSIPIFELKTSRFTFPITLNYAGFNGIKVDERAGWTGLGWVLELGGAVSRTINGADDFAPYGFKNVGLPSVTNILREGGTQNNMNYFDKIDNGYADTKPDNFYFSANGRSGKFIFTPNGGIEMIESNAIKVSVDNGDNFVLVDEDGNEYQFSDKEYVSSYYSGDIRLTDGYSTWYLSKMISADKTDTIKFEYISDLYPTYEYSHSFSQSYQADESCSGVHNLALESSGMTTRIYTSKRLKKISFKLGYIDLTSLDHREDGGGRRLSSIEVYGRNPNLKKYDLIKKIDFHSAYFSSDGDGANGYLKKRLKLDSLTINQKEKYRFTYSTIPLPPINSFAQDEWGYFNGELSNKSLLKAQQDLINGIFIDVGSANRSVSSNHIEAGILKRVSYPTGGYTTFEYSNNQFVKSYTKQTGFAVVCAANGMTPTNEQLFTVPETLLETPILTTSFRKFADLPGVNNRPFVRLTDMTTNQVVIFDNGDPFNDVLRKNPISLIKGRQYKLYAEAIGHHLVSASIMVSMKTETIDEIQIADGFGLRIKKVVNYDIGDKIIKTKEFRYGKNENGGATIISAMFNRLGYSYTGTYITGRAGGFGGCTRCETKRKVYLGNSFYNLSSFNGSPICYDEIAEYTTDGNKATGKVITKYGVYTDRSLPVTISYPNTIYQIPFSWPNGKIESTSVFKEKNGVFTPVKETVFTYDDIEWSVGKGVEIGKGVARGGCADQFIPLKDQFFDYYIFDYPIFSGMRRLKNITEKNYDETGDSTISGTSLFYNDKFQVVKKVVQRSQSSSFSEESKYPWDLSVGGSPSGIIKNMVERNILNPVMESKVTFPSKFLLQKNNYINPSPHVFAFGSTEMNNLDNNIMEPRLVINRYSTGGNVMAYKKNNESNVVYLYSYGGTYPIFEIKNADVNIVLSTLGGENAVKDLENRIATDTELELLSNLLRTALPNAQITSYTYKPLVGMTSKTDARGIIEHYQYDGFQRLQQVLDHVQQLRQRYDYHYRP